MKAIFVDRQKEMKAIRELLTGSNRKALILLGEGGIGKTRFLQEVNNIARKDFKKLGINPLIWWDFDEYIQKDRPETHIKNKFLEAAGLMEEVEDPHSISIEEVAKKINEIPQRQLLLFDTLEKLSDPRIKSGLFELFSKLNNSVFVFAGRPVKKNEQKRKKDFEDFVQKAKEIDPELKIITIDEFDQKNALLYIANKAKLRRVYISSSDKRKLAKLSHGVPILLDLAVDYLANNIRIQNLIDKVSGFEMQLVGQINKLKTPLDLAVLVLSVINPLDVSSFAKMLDISNPKTFFEKLQNLSFVKVLPDGQVLLHDKMEDLIIEHIWSNNNFRPSLEFEEQVLKKAFEIFKQRDQELTFERRALKEKLLKKKLSPKELVYLTRDLDRVTATREVVTQKWVRYGLALDAKSVWPEYTKLIRDVRTGNKFEFIQKLIDEVNEPVFPNRNPYWEILDAEQLYEFKFISARSKKDTGNLDEAIQNLESLLTKHGKNPEKRGNILNLLASAQTQTGRLEYLRRAIKNHEESLKIINSKHMKSRDSKYLLDKARIENQLGYTHRLLEDDESDAYEKANKHYMQGREFALMYKEHLREKLKAESISSKKVLIAREVAVVNRTLAAINNGLGYVQGLQKLYDDAYYHIDEAISIWGETGDSREIARAITSKAILKRDQGDFEDAKLLFSEALELPHAKDDQLNLSRVYHHKGWNEWELAAKAGFETAEGLRCLEQAHSSLVDSVNSLGVDSKYVRELSGIYHNISEMKWKLGQIYKQNGLSKKSKEFLGEAEKSNLKAIELSKESENRRYLVDALVGQAQYALDIKDFKKVEKHFKEVKSFEKKYPQFGLFYGRAYRLMGDALYSQRKYDQAFEIYSKAFPLIYQNKPGEGTYGFVEEQKLFTEKMNRLSKKMARKYFEYLRKTWSADIQNLRLFNWCDKEVYRLRKTE